MYKKPSPLDIRSSHDRMDRQIRSTIQFSGSQETSEKMDQYYLRRRTTINKKLSTMPHKPADSFLVAKETSLVAYIGGILRKWVKSMYATQEKDRRTERFKTTLSSRSVKRVLPSLQRLSYVEAERRRKKPTTCLSTQLSELEVIAVVSVFEDIYHILGIIETSISDGGDETSKILFYRTPLERFYRQPYDLPIIAGHYKVYDNEEKEAKRRECLKISRVLNETTKELLKEGSYTILQHAALIPFLVEREELDLLEDYRDNLRQMRLLRETIDDCRAVSRARSQTQYCKRCKVKGYCRKLVYHNGIENEYMDKWIDSRKFQNSYRLKRQEVKMQNTVEALNKKIKNTTYAHDNTMMYYRTLQNEILSQIDLFDRRHESDKEKLEFATEGLRIELKSTQYLKDDAQAAYEMLRKKVTRIRERRQKVIAEEKLYRRQVVAAGKIARWWRRILPKVLEQRKKKKKGKGKKGKK